MIANRMKESTPRHILQSIISENDISILENPREFRAFFFRLSDGEYKKELNGLIQSLEEKIPTKMKIHGTNVPYEILAPGYYKCLQEKYGLTRELAIWTIDSWAFAFGLLNDNIVEAAPVNQREESAQKYSKEFEAYIKNIERIYLYSNTGSIMTVKFEHPERYPHTWIRIKDLHKFTINMYIDEFVKIRGDITDIYNKKIMFIEDTSQIEVIKKSAIAQTPSSDEFKRTRYF